jgi:hypothetical protein
LHRLFILNRQSASDNIASPFGVIGLTPRSRQGMVVWQVLRLYRGILYLEKDSNPQGKSTTKVRPSESAIPILTSAYDLGVL